MAASVVAARATGAAAIGVAFAAIFDVVGTGRCDAQLGLTVAVRAVLANGTPFASGAGSAGTSAVDVGLVAVFDVIGAEWLRRARDIATTGSTR